MILLEAGNKIIAESLQFRIEKYHSQTDKTSRNDVTHMHSLVAGDKAETLDSHLADFDTVQYHLATPSAENRHVVRLSMRMPCFTAELANYGAVQVLEREYAGLGIQIGTKASPGGVLEDGFDVSLQWDMAAVSVDKRDELVRKVALLKTFSMGAPLEKAAREQLDGKPGNLMTISYRDHESIYVKASHDRVTVIFTTLFRDETDKILAKVFLQVSYPRFIHISSSSMALIGVCRLQEAAWSAERTSGPLYKQGTAHGTSPSSCRCSGTRQQHPRHWLRHLCA